MMSGLVIKLNGGRKLKLTVGPPEFWSLWRIEIRLSLGSGYGRVFFIAHVVMVAIFGGLRRILESRKAKSANDQEKVQSAAATKDNINGTSNDAKKAK